MNTLRLSISLILIGIGLESIAQNTKPEPIFGSVVERKIQKDSTKKKSSFNPLKPAFLRIGVVGGGLIGFESNSTDNNAGGTSGIRVEYGFSNRWSLVGEVNGNAYEGATFLRGQATLGINWMPFKSRRLQPYFGLGGGVGGDGFRGGRGGRNGRGYDGWFENTTENNQEAQGFAYARTGLNYVLFKKIISTAETGYQVPFNTSSSSGGLSLRVGMAYQLSRKIKK